MTMLRLPAISARDRRALAQGAAAIGIVLLVGRGLPAYRGWVSDTRAAATELATSVAQTEGAMRAGARLKDSLAARGARLAVLDSALLGGESPAASAAQLASALTTVASASRVRVGAVQIGADSTRREGPYAVVTVRADLVGDIGGLLGVLAAIEQEQSLIDREIALSADSASAAGVDAEEDMGDTALRDVSDGSGPVPIEAAEVRRQMAVLAGARARIRELAVTQPSPAAPASEPEMLRAELTVEALVRVTERRAARGQDRMGAR
jgi:hypothetical protein